jgi:hypothetical protein
MDGRSIPIHSVRGSRVVQKVTTNELYLASYLKVYYKIKNFVYGDELKAIFEKAPDTILIKKLT